MRSVIGPFADQIWREKQASSTTPFERNASAEQVYLAVQALSPQNDLQRSLQARAAQISNDLAQTRLLLFAESGNVIPAPFVAILVLWLVIIFASFSLFSALNATVFTCPFPFCAVGIVRNFPDSGVKPAVFGSDGDFERATARCSWATMKLRLLMSALGHKRTFH
jgi:hypothetical protein